MLRKEDIYIYIYIYIYIKWSHQHVSYTVNHCSIFSLWIGPDSIFRAILNEFAFGEGLEYNFVERNHMEVINNGICDNQGPDFDDMSSLFPCEIDDVIQYINHKLRERKVKTLTRN